MTLYRVLRDLSSFEGDALTAAIMRARICESWFEGLRWHRSYLDTATGHST